MRPIISFTAPDFLFMLQNRREIVVRRRKQSALFEIREACKRQEARSLSQRTEAALARSEMALVVMERWWSPAPTAKAGGIRVSPPHRNDISCYNAQISARPVQAQRLSSNSQPILAHLSHFTIQRATYRLDEPNSSSYERES